jgi:CrcB protein
VTSGGQAALKTILAIAVGASLGALLRWGPGLKLNSLLPDLPPGTLVANLVGACIIGVAIAYFATAPAISGEWRLLIITGFCGGLTTFSTFSAEVVSLLQQGRAAMAGGVVAVHVVGSVVMTFPGIGSVAWANGT